MAGGDGDDEIVVGIHPAIMAEPSPSDQSERGSRNDVSMYNAPPYGVGLLLT